MTHILLNPPKAYKIIVQNTEYEIDNKGNPLTIKTIIEKLSANSNRMKIQIETKPKVRR